MSSIREAASRQTVCRRARRMQRHSHSWNRRGAGRASRQSHVTDTKETGQLGCLCSCSIPGPLTPPDRASARCDIAVYQYWKLSKTFRPRRLQYVRSHVCAVTCANSPRCCSNPESIGVNARDPPAWQRNSAPFTFEPHIRWSCSASAYAVSMLSAPWHAHRIDVLRVCAASRFERGQLSGQGAKGIWTCCTMLHSTCMVT